MTPGSAGAVAGPGTADVVVIGAGILGAATAFFASRAGLSVAVVERGSVASGTSSHGEGNILLSDKEAGPELDLALYSHRVWLEDLAEHRTAMEFESKGGLVTAGSAASLQRLRALCDEQRAAGIRVELITSRAGLRELEPYLSADIEAGALYPDDAQVQPLLATHHLLRLARGHGTRLLTDTAVTGFVRSGDRVSGVRTTRGTVAAGAVVNCAGPLAGEIAALAHVELPVLPRRGFVLVTEPLPRTVRHKVYAAEYVGDVASSDAGLQVSPVVEGTPSGPILIGASRERVGFDGSLSTAALARLAGGAVTLFPALAAVRIIRVYHGFRPYCPDHLPVIGPDPRAPGLWHATGHEGAGVGLSVGTARLLAQALRGRPTDLDLAPFRPERLDVAHAA